MPRRTSHSPTAAPRKTKNSALRRSSRLAKLANTPDYTEDPINPVETIRKPKKTVNAKDDDFKGTGELTDEPSKPLYKLSSNIFPDLNAPGFGLAQEKLADEPFKVLVACVFLTRTKGTVSMPVCREMFRRYPNAEDIMNASITDIVAMLQPLGLHNTRAKTIVKLSTEWHARPQKYGERYKKLHYPVHGDGKDISNTEQPIRDETEDPRVAWEVAHLPGVGAYALDSWRIFCRDKLRGVRDGLLDVSQIQDMTDERAQEWTRVIPLDKELIAYVRWRWLRLGYLWNPVNGSKVKVDSDVIMKLQSRELRSYKDFDNPWIVYAQRPEEVVKHED